MPAINAGSSTTPDANPSTGAAVILSPFSGPTGSPFDAKVYADPDPADTSATPEVDPTNLSTGAMSTGIGFGSDVGKAEKVGMAVITPNFNDDYQPGISLPDGTSATTAILLAIGGGRSEPNDDDGEIENDGAAIPDPYDVQPILSMGRGQARDSATYVASPVTGFGLKTVTATGTVADGAAIEAGWLNRTGASILTGMSEFGVSTTPSGAVT